MVRAFKVAQLMRRYGFTKVYIYEGGKDIGFSKQPVKNTTQVGKMGDSYFVVSDKDVKGNG
jgi:hypothetical protein